MTLLQCRSISGLTACDRAVLMPWAVPRKGGVQYTTSGTTTCGSGSTLVACAGAGPEVVYSFNLLRGANATFDATAETFDGVMYVRTLAGCSSSTSIACNDDSRSTNLPLLPNVFLPAGSYVLVFDGFGSTSCGSFTFITTLSPRVFTPSMSQSSTAPESGSRTASAERSRSVSGTPPRTATSSETTMRTVSPTSESNSMSQTYHGVTMSASFSGPNRSDTHSLTPTMGELSSATRTVTLFHRRSAMPTVNATSSATNTTPTTVAPATTTGVARSTTPPSTSAPTAAPANVTKVTPAVQQASDGAGSAVVASSAAAGAAGATPGWSAHASRNSIIAQLLECPKTFDPNDELDPVESPGGASIGSRPTRLHLGAIAVDAGIVLGIVLLQLFIAALRYVYLKLHPPGDRSGSTHPGIEVTSDVASHLSTNDAGSVDERYAADADDDDQAAVEGGVTDSHYATSVTDEDDATISVPHEPFDDDRAAAGGGDEMEEEHQEDDVARSATPGVVAAPPVRLLPGSFVACILQVRLPRANYIWILLFLQPLTRCGLVVLAHSQADGGSLLEVVVGAVAVTAAQGASVFFAIQVTGDRIRAEYQIHETHAERSRLGRWLHPDGEWRGAGTASDRLHHKMYKPLYAPFRPVGRSFVVADLCTALAMAIIATVEPTTQGECLGQAASILVVCIGYLSAVLIVRPFAAPLDNALLAVLAALELLNGVWLVVFMLDQIEHRWAKEASTTTSLVTVYFTLAIIVKDCILGIVRQYEKYRGKMDAAYAAATVANDLDERPTGFAGSSEESARRMGELPFDGISDVSSEANCADRDSCDGGCDQVGGDSYDTDGGSLITRDAACDDATKDELPTPIDGDDADEDLATPIDGDDADEDLEWDSAEEVAAETEHEIAEDEDDDVDGLEGTSGDASGQETPPSLAETPGPAVEARVEAAMRDDAEWAECDDGYWECCASQGVLWDPESRQYFDSVSGSWYHT